MITINIEERFSRFQDGEQFESLVHTIAKMQMNVREVTHQYTAQFLLRSPREKRREASLWNVFEY